jgi:hypothetical protein
MEAAPDCSRLMKQSCATDLRLLRDKTNNLFGDLRQPPHVCLKLFRDGGRTMAGGDRHLERWKQWVSGEVQCSVSG